MMNFATVGTSWITSSFIEAAQQSEAFTFVAAYSRKAENARVLVDTYGAEKVYSDLAEMAKDPLIEVVYIASPNSVHFEQTLLFLKNKKHVICEKPIFSNLKEWEEAYRVAAENGVFLFEAIRNIHTPNFTILKENLALAGKVRGAVLPYMKYSSRYDAFLQGEEPNIFSANYSGGALVDLGVYPLYLAVGLFGAPEKSSYHPVMLSSGVDGGGTLVLDYEGFVVTILCSKIVDSNLVCEIQGEAGTFVLEDAAPISHIEFLDRLTTESKVISRPLEEKNMVYECSNIADIIRTNDVVRYEELKNLGKMVLSITEDARKQNKIIFASER